jgi:phenylpropionate dioxygenase-like ring-hydroxylating dioxygenase large terminal subunit
MTLVEGSTAALRHRIDSAIARHAPQRADGSWSPVERYLDADRHESELRMVRRWPLATLPVAGLRASGDWAATTVHGVPVLLSRAKDGVLRAFINTCRHRGAALAEDGSRGSDRQRFVCPYHSWTYATDGRCVGRPHDADFPHLDRGHAGLVPLSCAERFGLVWVIADGQIGPFDWDAYFGRFGEEIDTLGFGAETAAPHERTLEQRSNWKLIPEANLETYHFAYAHRETIAGMFHDNLVIHDGQGPNHRMVLPKRSVAELGPTPPALEGFAKALNVVYLFFPSTLVLWEGDHIDAFAVSPIHADACAIRGWLLVPPRHVGRPAEHWQRNFDIFWRTLDEDFALAASMQRGLRSGANRALCFGASEFACQSFHETVERELSIGRP